MAEPAAVERPQGRAAGRPRPVAPVAAVLAVALAVSALVSIGAGAASIPPADTASYLWAALTGGTIPAEEAGRYQIVWQIRTPRVLLAALVGAGLGAMGVAVQAMVRNALAEPYLLGVSAGAATGAVAVGVWGGLGALGIYAVSGGAFVGALAAALVVYLAAVQRTGLSPLRLVLVGVAMSFAFQAAMSVIVYFAPDAEAASTVLFWTMGGFGAASWATLPVVAVAVVAGIAVLARNARILDVLSMGEETASSLGVDSGRQLAWLLALTSLVTGVMVAVSGAIGFVGLIVPHVVRIVVGADHGRVLAVAPLTGAVLMVWIDLASRTLVAPRELPVGAVTALIGVPVFVYLLRRRGYLFGGS
ncbi:FecCD family ABC transporter permease [Glycomyces salinus]|uniref:FecCD family ABC transporter permease n=1 Tax=Glycomyces salinus TaxID=980294 RepID=UPI0018EBEFE9|nr:iron ABC transporter permease [Glycomyces salinus]